MRHVPFVFGVLAICVGSLAAQSTNRSEAWSKPVEGVQLRLAIPPNSAHTVSHGLPTLKMQIRNGANGSVRFSEDMLSCGSGIEIARQQSEKRSRLVG